jgi:uncharacterized protein DUF5677
MGFHSRSQGCQVRARKARINNIPKYCHIQYEILVRVALRNDGKTNTKCEMPDPIESELIGIESLEFLWTSSKQIVDHVARIEFNEARRFIAERCFRRIMLMTLTFLRLNPLTSYFPPNGHWDLPSCAAIARCILETYLRLFYFGVEKVDEAQGNFRSLLSQYHAQFQQLEIATDSRMSQDLLVELRAMRDKARGSLERNEYFQGLELKWKEKLIEDPSRLKLPEISQRAGISPGYHHSSYEFCSSFIHGSLYAMQLTEGVNLQTGAGKEYFRHLADIVCGYVALAIRDFKQLFPELPPLVPRLVMAGEFWSIIVRWETLPDFEEQRQVAHDLERPNSSTD